MQQIGISLKKMDPAWRTAIVVFLIARIALTIWMWGVRQVYSTPLLPDPVLRPYVGVAVEQNPWLEVWQRWDTLHYQAIAERGYEAFKGALFVPPLYPFLMNLVGGLLGGRTLIAGIIVSNLFYLMSLVALYRLTYFEMEDHEVAQRALIYLASFPTAFFLLAAYTESAFLLGAILAVYSVRKGSWWQAGIWGMICALARIPGFLIIVPLSYAALKTWRDQRLYRVWAAVGLPLIGAAIFPLYVWVGMHLPPWMPLQVQNARTHGGLSWPGLNLGMAVRNIFNGNFPLPNSIELMFTIVFLVGFVPVWRKLPRIYGIYYLSLMMLYLMRTGEPYPLLGMTRYVLVLFPIFILLGLYGRNSIANRLILYPSWVWLLYLSGQFAIWGWAG